MSQSVSTLKIRLVYFKQHTLHLTKTPMGLSANLQM